jgi:hypothetical protein
VPAARLPLHLRLLRPPLLLRVVHLVYVLVRLYEVDGQLAEGRVRRVAKLRLWRGGRGAGGGCTGQVGGRGHVDQLHGGRVLKLHQTSRRDGRRRRPSRAGRVGGRRVVLLGEDRVGALQQRYELLLLRLLLLVEGLGRGRRGNGVLLGDVPAAEEATVHGRGHGRRAADRRDRRVLVDQFGRVVPVGLD